MVELKLSGLPIWLNESTKRLEFRDGLACEGDGGKTAGQMRGLLRDETALPANEHCYDFYRGIAFEQDREVYQKYDFRYDITAIMPGAINGEFKKTSGHYHGYIEGTATTYPEVYEVLHGEAVFVMQKVHNFDQTGEPVIEEIRMVRAEAGQTVVIPPFWGHCSVNIGGGVLLFSNIAVVSCPVLYDRIKEKHGLAGYVLKSPEGITTEKNPHYGNVPDIRRVTPKENPKFGITFGKGVYGEFLRAPDQFDFLLHPQKYTAELEDMSAC